MFCYCRAFLTGPHSSFDVPAIWAIAFQFTNGDIIAVNWDAVPCISRNLASLPHTVRVSPSRRRALCAVDRQWIEYYLEAEIMATLDNFAGGSIYFGSKNLMAYAQLCLIAEEVERYADDSRPTG